MNFIHNFKYMLISSLCLLSIVYSLDSVNTNIVNANVKRVVDISTHLVRITSTISIENTGKSPISTYVYTVDNGLAEQLSFIKATKKSGKNSESTLSIGKASVSQAKTSFNIQIKSLASGAKTTIVVLTVFTDSLTALPAKISQEEKQLMLFNSGNLYFYSPYRTIEQSTTVKCFSKNIESYTKTKPFATAEDTIKYGPYKDIKAFSESELSVHAENFAPFLTVTSMERVIEISHWGNIAVEETYNVKHMGAELKGAFSRLDYQRQKSAGHVHSFKTLLPAAARDVYYRDEIGNISTSNLYETSSEIELTIRPRFPLFGGWKTHYYIGYNLPSYEFLYNSGDNYILKMRFIDHIFDDQAIDDLKVKIILPEGAKNIKLITPYTVKRERNGIHYTYLDTIGRTVIMASKKNLVDDHIQDFEVQYSFSKILLLQEPFLIIACIFCFFIAVIIFVRLDFSITKDEASDRAQRIMALTEDIQTTQDSCSALFQSYDDAINKFKISKDQASLASNQKKIDVDYKQITDKLTALASKLKSENSDLVDKVSELQNVNNQLRDEVRLATQLAEKLVKGSMSKDNYVDNEKVIRMKNTTLLNKADDIVSNL